MTTIATPARFEIGRVISRLLGVLSRNLASFLALSVLLVGLPTAAVGFLQLTIAASLAQPRPFSAFAAAIGLAVWLISLVANAVLQGAIIHGTVSDLAGQRASFGDCIGTGMRFILPLVGIGLITGIGIGFGLVLFVVPGVLLALAWSVAAPAEVMERTGVFGALGRSRELTRNHRGAILGLGVIYAVILILVQSMVSVVVMGFGGVSLAAAAVQSATATLALRTVVTFAAQTITAMIGAAGVASIYYELRLVKDGVGAEQLAAVFD